MSTLIAFFSLFLSIVFVQMGSGALGPLDALAGAAHGFSKVEIGMLGSAHYVGFILGCWATPRLMGRVGHSRAFAGLAAIGAIGALLHPVVVDPFAWSAMRVATGVAVAGAYTVIESWLNARSDNATRGRVFGVFRLVDLGAQVAAQALIGVLNPAAFVSYNVIALFCCLCVLPLAFTRRAPPPLTQAPRLRPWRTMRLSPLGASAAVVAGLSSASFRMVGPIYGAEQGLDPAGIALFLAAAVLGGALAQAPVGWLSDRVDRRRVLIGLSAGGVAVCGAGASGAVDGAAAMVALSFAFGCVAFPLYSVGAAHANDFAPADMVVELNAALLFLFACGAIVSPLVAAELVERSGPEALFAWIAVAHAALIAFGLWRAATGPRATRRGAYAWLPRTSFVVPRATGREGAAEVTPPKPPS
jgi:MFS family permease